MGYLNIRGIEPGEYDLRVKHSHTLQDKINVTLVEGLNQLSDCVTLPEGDANNDNYVMLNDFSILVTTFGKCESDDGYDERADFNEDDCVTILDFSMLATNFGQAGDDFWPWPGTLQLPAMRTSTITPLNDVFIVANAQPIANEQLCMGLEVQAGEQAVDGAAAHLDFPAELLQVETITMGEALAMTLEDDFDNKQGTIDIAAGTLSDFPSGTFELAEVCFTVTGNLKGSAIDFQFDAPRQTDVTFGGASILTSATNATLGDTPDDKPTVVALRQLDVTPQLPAPSLYLLLALVAVGIGVRRIRR